MKVIFCESRESITLYNAVMQYSNKLIVILKESEPDRADITFNRLELENCKLLLAKITE